MYVCVCVELFIYTGAEIVQIQIYLKPKEFIYIVYKCLYFTFINDNNFSIFALKSGVKM